jgi:hypothetical protein
MLKGKKGIYILIPLNVLIWGFFIYRFISIYNEGEISVDNGMRMAVNVETTVDSVSYKLNLAYSDPFLRDQPKIRTKALTSSQTLNVKRNKVAEIVKLPKENEKTLPDIKYLGLVKNNANGTVTAIITINGSSKLIRQDDIIDGMCFKNFTTENLTVLRNKEKLIISK